MSWPPDEFLSALLVTGGLSSRRPGTLLDAKAHEIVTSIEPPGDAPERSGCNDHRISLGLLIMARLIRDQSVLLSVALAATLWSSAALPQRD